MRIACCMAAIEARPAAEGKRHENERGPLKWEVTTTDSACHDPGFARSWEVRMKVDVTAATAFGNGAAAIALLVALLEALRSSEKLSAQEVDRILDRAAAMLSSDLTVGRDGLKTIKSIVA